jgi:hypothetical protein
MIESSLILKLNFVSEPKVIGFEIIDRLKTLKIFFIILIFFYI